MTYPAALRILAPRQRTVVVSAGSYGAYLGRLTLNYTKGAGATPAGYELTPILRDVPDNPGLARQIARFKGDVDKGYLVSYKDEECLGILIRHGAAADKPSPGGAAVRIGQKGN